MAAIEGSRQSLLEIFQKNKSRRLNELRKEDEFCDLILKSEDDIEIRLHRVVLSSASNYFKDLLTTQMREKYAECIPLPYVNGDVLEKIISFIYTNEFDEKVEDVEVIIKHAVAFQLEELIEICSLILKESINDASCLNYWRLCRDNLIYDLENKCLAYIVSKADYLFENSFLNDLTIEEMRCLLADDKLRLQCYEQNIFEYVWKWAAGKVSDTQNFSQVLSEVIDLLRFSQLGDEFIFSRIFCNDDLVDNGELLTKVAKLTNIKHKLQNKNETPGSLIFPKPTTRRLLGLSSNKMFTSLEENENKIQTKEKLLPDFFAYTTFDMNFLLICGGYQTKSCEYLDPIAKDWRKFPSLKSERWVHNCTYLDNKIYACGGHENKSVEVFELGTEQWYDGPEMLSENNYFGLTALNGVLYAVGGTKSENVEILDPRIPKWSVVNSDFFYKIYTRCVSIGPCIYCFTSMHRLIFDTRMNKFAEEITSMDLGYEFNCCELDGYIYSFGFARKPLRERTSAFCVGNEYSLKLIQYRLDGTRGYTNIIGQYDNTSLSALVALYY